ncbi:protein-tyrosine phosphatase family protein [Halorubrum sp. SY-15]|uniref:protein-tyrosine phosphatase family protein n=1 Tax=Halorubrum sp. SY-15 TaxID=3402277 RepID=UPI003EBA807A
MIAHHIAPVDPDTEIVYGACRPGYPATEPDETDVAAWLAAIEDHGIKRVCCLLSADQLQLYDDLLDQYQSRFGSDHVLHAPVQDHTPVSTNLFSEQIWPFLKESMRQELPAVVHCSAGIGRTGQVLTLWLALEHDYDLETAIHTVRNQYRDPLESVAIDTFREMYDALL